MGSELRVDRKGARSELGRRRKLVAGIGGVVRLRRWLGPMTLSRIIQDEWSLTALGGQLSHRSNGRIRIPLT